MQPLLRRNIKPDLNPRSVWKATGGSDRQSHWAGVLAMKHVLIIAAASVGVAELLNTSVFEPAAWAVVLAGIAGSGFIGRRRTKKSIEIEDETPR